MNITAKNISCHHGFHIFLKVSLQRSCTIDRIISVLYNVCLGCICKLDLKFLVLQSLVHICQHQIHNVSDVIFRQRFEQDDLIQTVQKLWSEVSSQVTHYLFLTLRTDIAFLVNAFQQIAGTNVGGHDQNRVLEVHSSSLGIGNTTIIQYLQQYIEYIRMGFFHLIKKDNGVWTSSDCLCQLSAFFIAYISWRRSDQTGYGVFLHILTHVNTHHILFIIKQTGSQCFCKLRLTYTSWSKEQE